MSSGLLSKLEFIKDRWEEVGKKITDPEIIADMKQYVKLNKEYKDLEPIVNAYNNYKLTLENIESSKEILETEKDEEFRDMAKLELDELGDKKRPSPPRTGNIFTFLLRARNCCCSFSTIMDDFVRCFVNKFLTSCKSGTILKSMPG